MNARNTVLRVAFALNPLTAFSRMDPPHLIADKHCDQPDFALFREAPMFEMHETLLQRLAAPNMPPTNRI